MIELEFIPLDETYEQHCALVLTVPQLITFIQADTCEKTTLSIMKAISENIKEDGVSHVLYMLDQALEGMICNRNKLYNSILKDKDYTIEELEDEEIQVCWSTDTLELLLLRELKKEEDGAV